MSGTLKGLRSVLSIEDGGYPESLRALGNPPESLYVIGDASALEPGLAIIGARKATPYGKNCARRFARIAAEKGVCIISGGARGCDSEAHRAALDAKTKTVVFLGGGCDCIYPPEHQGLFQSIVDAGGAIVSEHPWSFKPLPYTFRMRNRLIAGLAEAVLIVEAGLPSGTFSTADEALSMGKEVLVVPGSIASPESHGSNRLLYQGALPVVDDESFEDILFSTMGVLRRPEANDSDESIKGESGIVAAILAAPITMDEAYSLAIDIVGAQAARSYLTSELARGEAQGIIARHPDGRWGPTVRR